LNWQPVWSVYASRAPALNSPGQLRSASGVQQSGKIPQDLRVSVDSKQVGKYLDRVLAIIAKSGE